jgi:hypothetical protein
MIAVAALAGTAAYALFLLGGESRFFAACMAVLAMCAAIVIGY